VVSQHGGTLWLGSLVAALAPIGINERLVRTSVFRLVQEGWLVSERLGRRSYYRFSDYGSHEYQRAARRIYALNSSSWDGRWQLLIPLDVPDNNREKFRRSLHWQGFRTIATNTYAKPGSGHDMLAETLEEFNLSQSVLVMHADTDSLCSRELIGSMVRENWKLDDVATGYRAFLQRFEPLLKGLHNSSPPTPQLAFVARLLLIHDYRRVLLQDTELPSELLPSSWPGAQARQLTSEIYAALAENSCQHICEQFESNTGLLPKPGSEFEKRFPGESG
jgi:phenylacetic acid degradation operon negative regulatory protein